MAITKTWITIGVVGDAARPRVYEEEGSPASIQATSLQSYTNYVADAGCISDGLQCLAMQRVQFQTLRQNNLSATFFSCRRMGIGGETAGGWKVTYSYTSLYALSSVILHVEHEGLVTEYQGTADYNTQRLVWDIPAGDWDCCGAEYYISAKVYDIFGEFYQSAVTGIITDTFNLVNMSYASSTTSSVTFDLDYWLDSGFASGWLDVWNEGDDPDTDQPQDHYHFSDGDTQVTADGLAEGTTYIFRATVVLDDGQGTEIYTAYQNASTAGTDYRRVPMFFENTSTETEIRISVFGNGSPSWTPSLQKSTDGSTWETYDVTTDPTLVIPVGEKVYIKGDNASGFNQDVNVSNRWYFSIGSTTGQSTVGMSLRIGGDVMSLLSASGFGSVTSIPDYCFRNLFYDGNSRYDFPTDASNLNFGRAANVGVNGCTAMFYPFTALSGVPDTSSFTNIAQMGCSSMFEGCANIVSPPNFSNVKAADYMAFVSTFSGCTSLRTAPQFTSLDNADGRLNYHQRIFDRTFSGCGNLAEPAEFPLLTRIENQTFLYTYQGCLSLARGSDLTAATVVGTQGLYGMYDSCSALSAAYYPNVTVTDRSEGWLVGCAASGTVYVPNQTVLDAVTAAGYRVVPNGWRAEIKRQ